jgi:2-keto-3-deoxy-L-fuconate dehydrogenase
LQHETPENNSIEQVAEQNRAGDRRRAGHRTRRGITATDINADTLAELEPHGIKTTVLDATDRSAVDSVIKGAGPLDVLVNCAGFVHHGNILACDQKDWEFSFNLNVNSSYYTISAALPAMLDNGGGSIIIISSVASSIKGVPNRFVYGTTKAALLGLTKSVAADYVSDGIRCNAICPGTVDSPSLHDRLRATGDYDQAMKDFVARQPMGRLGTAEEIANLCLYLGSDESAFTTGQAHIVDGGWAV